MTEPTTPIVVDPSPVTSQVYTGLRDIAILLSGCTALLGFVSKHDLAGAIGWLQSNAAIPFVATCIAIGTFAFRQWKARQDKAEKVVLAQAAPNSVAVVTGEPK